MRGEILWEIGYDLDAVLRIGYGFNLDMLLERRDGFEN
jgi:hypothetical protein